MAHPENRRDDDQDLLRYGYVQELFRNMGGFSNFAISFSIISILTGAVTLYGYGLDMGGPLEMTLGWPIATVFTLALAASMGELTSAYPTSGAMYHWAAALGGVAWGWFVAWLNIIGLIAAQAGINYSCAQFVLPFLGIAPTPRNILLMFAFTLLVQGLLNHYGVRLVAMLNDLSVSVHIAGVILIVTALFMFAPLQKPGFLVRAVSPGGHSPYWWAFLLGLLQAHWTFTGFDGSAHMAEETTDPRRTAPWGTVISVAVSGVFGYALLLALTLAIRSFADLQHTSQPVAIAILQSALGVRIGNVMAALASMAMWFCGLACLTSASRALFSLARDNGVPFAAVFRKVSARRGTPWPAIWGVAVATFAAMLWTGAVPVVTSLSTVALYLAYVIPIWLGWRAGRRGVEWRRWAPWNLGRFAAAVNGIAMVYTAFICIILTMPPNQLAGETLAGVLAILTILYFVRVRTRFRGPEWAASLRKEGSVTRAPGS